MRGGEHEGVPRGEPEGVAQGEAKAVPEEPGTIEAHALSG